MNDFKDYKGFKFLGSWYSDVFKSTIVSYTHEKTGMDVVHFVNDDLENTVFFGFRTADPTSKGTPHIVEHTVLCGSEKYKVKDPFITMAGQSLKTYLNAFTYSDFTGYPVSSTNKKDLFNLASVYANAVFFPMLDEGAFMQEGHRLEVDDNGDVSIQGVVYNEMKGAYSNPYSVMYDSIIATMTPGTIYEKDSGGDPLVIPSLTYKEFVDFHKKWYRPSNCLVGLYGNIPTEEYLDFLDKEVLSRWNSDNTPVFDEYNELVTMKSTFTPSKKPVIVKVPTSDNDSTDLAIAWNLGEVNGLLDSYKNDIIVNVLLDNESSPVQKAMVDTGACTVGDLNGIWGSKYGVLSVNAVNVEKGKTKKIVSAVNKAIKDVVKNGVDKRTREKVVNKIKFSILDPHKINPGINYIISYMGFWRYGLDMLQFVSIKQGLDYLCERALEPGYIESLIEEKVLKNSTEQVIVFDTSSKYTNERAKAEKDIINNLLKATTKEQIQNDYKIMENFQNTYVDDSSLPSLGLSDLLPGKDVVRPNDVTMEYIQGKDGKGIPLFSRISNMPGVSAIRVGFPVDLIKPEEYKYLELVAQIISDIGYDDVSWEEANNQMSTYASRFFNDYVTIPFLDTPRVKDDFDRHKDYSCRDYIFYKVLCLSENVDKVLKILERLIVNPNFNDTEKIEYIIKKYQSDLKRYFESYGNSYATVRSNALRNINCAKDELTSGVTHFKFVEGITDYKAVGEVVKSIFERAKDSGSIVFVSTSKDKLEDLKGKVSVFVKNAELKALAPRSRNTEEDFYKVLFSGLKQGREHLKVNTRTGYSAMSFSGPERCDKNYAPTTVVLEWLGTNYLWEQLRTVHGCYGAYAAWDANNSAITFSTYRDPKPTSSNEEFVECLKRVYEKKWTDKELTNSIISRYGRFISPRTTFQEMNHHFNNKLESMSDDDEIELIDNIRNLKVEDLSDASKFIYEKASEGTESEVVFTSDLPEDYKVDSVINF